MKPIVISILIACSLVAHLHAQKPKAIPKNTSRIALDAYKNEISQGVGNLSKVKPETKLPMPIVKLGKDWSPRYRIAKDDNSIIVHFMPRDEKFLEHGRASVYITNKPFNIKLTEAPNVLDNSAAIEFEIQRWLPQKWQSFTIPALKNLKVRAYQDMQSGGADNETHATEPFSIKTQSGKVYWVIVSADYGYHKTKGMTLQRALKALTFQ